jgi:hypothetical protein
VSSGGRLRRPHALIAVPQQAPERSYEVGATKAA